MLAKQLYYWPGMSVSIQNIIENCDRCQQLRPSLHANPQQHPQAEAPMHSVAVDLFSSAGKDYLVMVDRFSNFMWVKLLPTTTTEAITNALAAWFLDFGYPFIIISDNGPQFRADFKTFCDNNHILHSTSSPYNPRSNGLAESAVKSAKYLLQKSSSFKDFQNRLLAWRNVPSANCSASPSEKFYNRRQRTDLPSFPIPALPTPPLIDDLLLPALSIGDPVRLQDPKRLTWDTTGHITQVRPSGLSYVIRPADGGPLLERGRRLVKFDKTAARLPPPARPAQTAPTLLPPPSSEREKPIEDVSDDPPRRSRRTRQRPRRYR